MVNWWIWSRSRWYKEIVYNAKESGKETWIYKLRCSCYQLHAFIFNKLLNPPAIGILLEEITADIYILLAAV